MVDGWAAQWQPKCQPYAIGLSSECRFVDCLESPRAVDRKPSAERNVPCDVMQPCLIGQPRTPEYTQSTSH